MQFRLSFSWFGLALLCFSAASYALTPTEIQEQRQQDREQSENRARQQQAPDVRLNPPAIQAEPIDINSTTLPTETTCFNIQHIIVSLPEITGLPTKPYPSAFNFLQDDVDQYAGRCIGREGINLILQRLTAHITSKGYTTTRIGVPEQNLSNGELKLILVPGIIRNIHFKDETLRGTLRTAFPASAGDILNLRDLEQGLEQMKRVASQDVDMQLVPGALPGETDVVIAVKREKPWKVTMSLDDSGLKATGKRQGGLNFALDNPLGLNDLFNIGVNTDTDREGNAHGTRGKNIYYSIPLGYWTFSLSGSQYDYHQQIAGTNQTFVSSGVSSDAEIKIQRLFYRDQKQKVTLQFRTGKQASRSFIDDTEIDVQRRKTSFAEIALLDRYYLGEAQIDVTLAQRQGVHWFGAQDDVANRLSTDPTYFYHLQTIDATLSLPFKVDGQSLKYLSTFHGQTTNNPLYASEQISIGNRYTVRGFDGEQTLATEEGFYWRNELEIPINQTNQAFYAMLDTGKVYGPSVANLLGDKLTGAGFGLRGGGFGISYDVFTSWAIDKPDGYRSARPATGVSVSYQF
jgi:hemolysin activation/secretion protein